MKIREFSVLVAMVALVSGCQSTSIRSAWFDTDFAGPPMRKVVVVGGVNSVTGSRILDDILVEKLRAAGVEAIAGRTINLDDPSLSESAFAAIVVNTGEAEKSKSGPMGLAQPGFSRLPPRPGSQPPLQISASRVWLTQRIWPLSRSTARMALVVGAGGST